MVAGKHFLVHDGQVQVVEHTVNGEVLLEMWGWAGWPLHRSEQEEALRS